MALNPQVLKVAIKVRMQNAGFIITDPYSKVDEFVDILVEEIITHFKTYARVNGPVTVASVSGVTVGTGISGPGTGTAVNGILS